MIFSKCQRRRPVGIDTSAARKAGYAMSTNVTQGGYPPQAPFDPAYENMTHRSRLIYSIRVLLERLTSDIKMFCSGEY